jgi:16S rRNA (cytosine1402-N4)-methyltransferase
MAATVHIPVMLDEVLEWLEPRAGKVLVDGTLGGGGHTRALAERVGPDGFVLALDRDPAAIERASERLRGLPVQLANRSFHELPELLAEIGRQRVDGVLLDLGLSSDQLADAARGFSYESTGPLDLRFDPDAGEPAWRLLEYLPEKAIADLIYAYGEERFSRRIARRIVERRKSAPLQTSAELAALVRGCVPRSKNHRIDPATRTFQALRIAVNDELRVLSDFFKKLPDYLAPNGRCVIISFHSLEDRIVKNAFREDPRWSALTKKPVLPKDIEVARNPRSRSAKLRVAQRLPGTLETL